MRLPLVAACLLVATPAVAQAPTARAPGGAPPPAAAAARTALSFEPIAALIAACDTDVSGSTTIAELRACIAAGYGGIDTSRAGKLGYIAFGQWAARFLGDVNALPGPWEIDRNGDDRITPDELQTTVATAFTRFDKDRDGAATRAELLTRPVPREPDDGRRDRRGRRGRDDGETPRR